MTNSNRKCGEITFCTQLGKRVYVLNCIYCPHICLQWEMFIYHLEHEHDKSLNLEPIVQPEISKMPIKMEIPESITDEPTIAPPKKQKMLEEPLPSSAFDDPLESENSTSEMCLESCIKIEQEEECSPNLNLFETEENSSETTVSAGQFCNTVPLSSPQPEELKDCCENCFNLKDYFGDKFMEVITIIVKQNAVIIKAQADQKVLIEKILNQEITCNSERKTFPLKSLEDLNKLDSMIREDNREIYINILKSLLKGRLSKTLTDVISESLCMEVNLDGVQGKKRLKDFTAFYQVLTDACRSFCSMGVEKDLKDALKNVKRRQIQKKCYASNKMHSIKN